MGMVGFSIAQDMSEQDKIALTLQVAQEFDCYFDHVTVKRNIQHKVIQISIRKEKRVITTASPSSILFLIDVEYVQEQIDFS